MNKLININIDRENNKLSFQIQLTAEIDDDLFMVFVDECDNINNIYSDLSENHSYYFNAGNSTIIIEELGGYAYTITIEHKSIADMDNHMKYIKVFSGENNPVIEGIYYDEMVVFNAELTHIKKVCDTCLDDKTMQLLMHVVFKRQLLESALTSNDCKQCIVLYQDLCRLLNIDVNDVCNCNQQCQGGCCNIK